MRTSEDASWELIGSLIAAESSGKSPRLFSSRRTLFGIPSALDEELAKLDQEVARRAGASEQAGASKPGEAPERVGEAPKPVSEATASPAPEPAGVPKPGGAPKPAGTPRQTQQHVVHPLAPVFDERSRVLILGTMPSPKSRETGFYYNHPQNRFWKVMAALFDEPIPAANQEKKELVLAHGVALWDVLAECTIRGASDGTIAECVPNDIAWLIGQAPVEAVFCTGAKAAELYKKYCEPSTRMPCTRLPSTSPANAATSLDQLIEAYRQILPFCVQA
ncbi:DNA-deoxyinosine glycosylase [Adlercreutzia sp. ZJ473]|uniref:DNA-deoxyinosine glycosylase n=1 Tax=Adlercreutzia sp. ZJ473 TaxID=2722822 RepID=UPI001C1323F1|nr:DNA-deoxyinosine glycosylase [Adlercreutzia sp. ZJ473]